MEVPCHAFINTADGISNEYIRWHIKNECLKSARVNMRNLGSLLIHGNGSNYMGQTHCSVSKYILKHT